ncbi:UDP-N-acetylmuramoyl-tripeptide--D-alanyl-D-alanine ligase [Peribacillus cavernae]|uniref:UDP-N-acetylmuramoyl-tripeptide--D-alanyl-D-alanine ligase n=1 Tax=Peribacillus cavernae TaxID=1674310 RepID=A0A3S0TS69_9BACI|nr:UDP-N-acetylmuramoyl-tripeptide--D-alanyl-D-alanine ligase [Peribacillus cavernae]MDQ0221276.1 UDP-N-acetylmuramoyl-tripeptide--D-alanyl-D-alanine ligase [Peribacillus cavernae]RUQ26980.1 UDP-N-acetylmuramoyl-tripeptide--D-alanyl-D-alanine ligase [Peribacillus cavernae]
MIVRTLKQIHKMAGGLNDISEHGGIEVHGVSIDSRNISKKNLFVPLNGEQVNGHQYVEMAISQGASASLWQEDVPNPPKGVPLIVVTDTLKALQHLAEGYRNELTIKVVGITGSNGKTTTKDMTAALLETTYRVHKTSGNYNNHIGLPLTILSMTEDTEAAVLEMGMSSRGEIEFLSKLARPDVAIITNIGEAHLLDLGSREEIANAKFEIMVGLSENGTLIYHGDEPLLQSRVRDKQVSNRILSFGRSDTNDLYPLTIKQEKDSTIFTLPETMGEYIIPVLGNHNVLNALAAMLAAKELHVDEESIRKGLRSFQLTHMRMEMVEGLRGEKIINDAYNASPTSMKAAIELIEDLTGFPDKYLVLGDMLELGPQEQGFHEKIGELIDPEKINKVFTFGELGKAIAEGAGKRFSSENIFAFQDKNDLIAELRKHAKANDVILVKASRGMKLEEVVHALQK